MSDENHHFIYNHIKKDLDEGRINSVVLRFPPEPNGFLHIGHAKSICLNFSLSQAFNGQCNLRFDDTNPSAEKQQFFDAIIEDIKWLGFKPNNICYTSDYFSTLYEWAQHLVRNHDAYVCYLDAEGMRTHRGTLKQAGMNSPYRDASVAENMLALEKMRCGKFEAGFATLRAKIDMTHSNFCMRDPVLYRIKHGTHQRTGTDWCIYPSYDFSHGQSDAIEGITHSLCTLEFSDHTLLYNWLLDRLPVPCKPVQHEFARLELTHVLTSKRKLKNLIDKNIVSGWDDPRMPTLAGMRRAGYSAESIKEFCRITGVSRANSTIDKKQLDFCLRQDLDKNSDRAMCVLRPIKLTLTNISEINPPAYLKAPNNPHQDKGERKLPFSDTLYIEREDFLLEANKKYKRLVLGGRVRLRYGYIIEAHDVRQENGTILEVMAKIIPDTLGKNTEDGIKVRGVIHWVCSKNNAPCTVNLYNNIFLEKHPDKDHPEIASNSVEVLQSFAELTALNVSALHHFQFERQGYFCRDIKKELIFNRTISLRDGSGGFA